MKHRLLLSAALLFLALPACQSKYQKIVEDQDRQMDTLKADQQRLLSERDRVRAENAALQERLTLEQMRTQELEDRLSATSQGRTNASDAELESLRGRLSGTGVEVGRRGQTIVLDLPQAITFSSGKADLTRTGKNSLNAVAGVLSSDYAGKTYWIEGHTDNDPIRKSGWKSNLHLSVMRALAVADYLAKDLNLPSEQVRVAGHGEHAPRVENSSTDNKARNRRVEILILD